MGISVLGWIRWAGTYIMKAQSLDERLQTLGHGGGGIRVDDQDGTL